MGNVPALRAVTDAVLGELGYTAAQRLRRCTQTGWFDAATRRLSQDLLPACWRRRFGVQLLQRALRGGQAKLPTARAAAAQHAAL